MNTNANDSNQVRTALESLIAGIGKGDVDSVLGSMNILASLMTSPDARALLESSLSDIKQVFDSLSYVRSPNSLSMATTNLPDSLKKLSDVLSMSSESTHSVLSILDQQELLLEHSERLLETLEKAEASEQSQGMIASFIEQERVILKESRTLMTRLLSAQEYQDLCGQSVAKVMRMNEELNSTVAQLLELFNIPLMQAAQQPTSARVQQDEADDLLKELGI